MKKIDKLFESLRNREFLFLGALIVALIGAFYISPYIDDVFFFPLDGFELALSILTGIRFDGMVIFIYGPMMWIVYIVIILVGTKSNKLRTSKILFFVFVSLLLASFYNWIWGFG